MQAVGRDARGASNTATTRAIGQCAFGAVLAIIRRRVRQDLERRALPKQKVLATVVRLLETTFIRVGNHEYAKENESFGLTTMRDRHVRIAGARLLFQFRGKSGQEYELFQYVDENGVRRAIDSADVNEYIREIAGEDFTAKDFRTWAGTVLAVRELCAAGPASSARQGKRTVVNAVKSVARRL